MAATTSSLVQQQKEKKKKIVQQPTMTDMATTNLKGHPPKFKSKLHALNLKTSIEPNPKTQIKIANP